MCPEKITGIAAIDSQSTRTGWNWETVRNVNEIGTQVRRANNALAAFDVQAKFSVHQGTGQIMVRIENTETGELIREIPPEKFLDLIAKMRELTAGVVDKHA